MLHAPSRSTLLDGDSTSTQTHQVAPFGLRIGFTFETMRVRFVSGCTTCHLARGPSHAQKPPLTRGFTEWALLGSNQ